MDSRHPQYHPRTVSAEQVIAEARKWIGTLYRHQGRNEAGLDCIGFIVFVLAQLKILPDEFERNNYGRMLGRAHV